MKSKNGLKIDRDRIPRSLFISGLTIVPAWLFFVVVHTSINHPPFKISDYFDARTIAVQSTVIPILLVVVTGFVLTYGGFVYWLLLKFGKLSYIALLVSSTIPAVAGTILIGDSTVIFPLLLFCFWHCSVSWFYVRLK